MEKIDLTLESIIGSDFDRSLMPLHIRQYTRDTNALTGELISNIRILTEIEVEWDPEYTAFHNRERDDLNDQYDSTYHNVFGEDSPWRTNTYWDYILPKLGDECDRCGTKTNILTGHYGLCYPCNELDPRNGMSNDL